MKLYIIIYLSGLIGGSVGPLPYDFDECSHRIDEMKSELNPNTVTPDGYKASDVKFACEWHDKSPEANPDAGKSK